MAATAWTRVDSSSDIARLLPAWFAIRMTGTQGAFGLLLTTGDVLRITSVTAVHLSSDGTLLVDVLLDHAGVPEGTDMAWRPKHYLGAPVAGADMATVNFANVVAAVELSADVASRSARAEVEEANVAATVLEIREAVEGAADTRTGANDPA